MGEALPIPLLSELREGNGSMTISKTIQGLYACIMGLCDEDNCPYKSEVEQYLCEDVVRMDAVKYLEEYQDLQKKIENVNRGHDED